MPSVDLLQRCRNCQHEFRVPAKLAGRKVNCPYCRRLMDIVGDAAAGEADKLVGQMLGGCRLLRRLGAGALGVVYEAEQLAMHRHVAMKLLSSKAASNPQLVQRFQREAKICAQINHPNVVGVFDCGIDRGVHFLMMELVDGTTLAGLIDESGPVHWQKASALILQVAKGLEHARGLNIVHRDVKPANILITSAGVAKLADLGLAKQVEDEGADAMGLTMQGVALGSPAYMAPEQIRDARQATHVADIYSLGATFYHLIAGAPPFEGRSGAEVMTKVLREQAKPLSERVADVPPAISSLVALALSKDPRARPQDANAFIFRLESALTAPMKPVTTRSSRLLSLASGPSTAQVVILGLTALVLVGIVLWKFVLT